MIEYQVVKGISPSDKKTLYRPARVAGGVVNLDTMCSDIAAKTTLTRADVHGTLCAVEEQIVKHVKQGRIVKFGLLGTFRPVVVSNTVPVDDSIQVEQINRRPSAYVRKVRVRFFPSVELSTRVNVEAKFQKVESVKKF